MDDIMSISFMLLWVLVLILLGLNLRMIRWFRAIDELQKKADTSEEIAVGTPAPDFRAQLLDGTSISLTTFQNRSVAFLFVSPNCGACHEMIPMLLRLAPLARENAQVEFMLVSDADVNATNAWMEAIADVRNVVIDLPIVVVPRGSSPLLELYNPRGYTPYYCIIDTTAIIQARGSIGRDEWHSLRKSWEKGAAGTTSTRLARKYL
ncbi:MAG: hypothetical protein GFH25_541218n30 [Chloroflexi bacterium AL-N10]|nr:hypothetical protein [Chloroflexi bacterium AL-N1]NOK69892.1 hypothetical protein [Chloroflexi bacterium AL-N10]NOK73811.1 hypothetical protein [Chloroflexi bacterium AL-N5]NOK91625.1 hypothetical protein [Chloroflexi bacterium AL-N15]